MVSSPHEAMHRIFQEDPGLFARALRPHGLDIAEPVSCTPVPNDATTVEPLERRIDTVLQLKEPDGSEYLLVVEAQSKEDPAKHSSWPYYLGFLLAKYGLPPVLLVVCNDTATAAWAREPVRIGLPKRPTLILEPLVLGPHNTAVVTTPEQAAEDIPAAVLSAILHRTDKACPAILEALSKALRDLEEIDEEQARCYIELVAQGLGRCDAGDIWRYLVAHDLSFFTSPLSEEIRDEGRAEGKAEGKAEVIIRLLERRGLQISADDRDRITGCTDLDVLDTWFDRAITAATTHEVFEESGD